METNKEDLIVITNKFILKLEEVRKLLYETKINLISYDYYNTLLEVHNKLEGIIQSLNDIIEIK